MSEDLSTEARLTAARYARVLGLVERCAAAMAEGSWVDLDDFAGELSAAADELAASGSAMTREPVAVNPTSVLALVLGLEPPSGLYAQLHGR